MLVILKSNDYPNEHRTKQTEKEFYLRIIFVYFIIRKLLEAVSKNFSVFIPHERRTKQRKRIKLMHPCIVYVLPLLQLFLYFMIVKFYLFFQFTTYLEMPSDVGPLLLFENGVRWLGLGIRSASLPTMLLRLLTS